MCALTGDLYDQFVGALWSAFPTEFDLLEMVRVHLNGNLYQLVAAYGGNNLHFGLIQWAEAHGQTERLLEAARSCKPGNTDLVGFQRRYFEWKGRREAGDANPCAPLTPHTQNPYPGLRSFTEKDGKVFFGRTQMIARLHDTVRELSENNRMPRFISVVGASGAGKSSLVRAGLVPALRKSAPDWIIKRMVPGDTPLTMVAQQFLQFAGPRSLRAICGELNSGPAALHVLALEALARRPEGAFFVLAIDEFEEVFSESVAQAERTLFMQQLIQAASTRGGRCLIVVAMRADFYPRVGELEYGGLANAITASQTIVGRMGEDDLRDVIVCPARETGVQVEEALVEALIHDATVDPGGLPLLQHALRELYEGRRTDVLTITEYRAGGGLQRRVAEWADTVYKGLTREQREVARLIFLRLVQHGEGTQDTRRRVSTGAVHPFGVSRTDVEAVIDKLVSARLLMTDQQTTESEPVLYIAHDALIQAWPTLKTWLDEDQESSRIRRRLSENAEEWNRRGRPELDFYTPAQLATAKEWEDQHPHELNRTEKEFLEMSTRLRTAQQDAEIERERLHSRRLSTALAIAGVLVVLLVGVALATLAKMEEASRLALVAEAAQLTTLAESVFEDDPLLGVRLAIEGLELVPDDSSGSSEPARKLTWNLMRYGRLRKLSDHAQDTLPFDSSLFVLQFGPRRSAAGFVVCDAPEVCRTHDGQRLALSGRPSRIFALPGFPYYVVNYEHAASELLREDGNETIRLNGPVRTATSESNSSREQVPALFYGADRSCFVVAYDGLPGELRCIGNERVAQLAEEVSSASFDLPAPHFFVAYSGGHASELRRSDTGDIVAALGNARGVSADTTSPYFLVQYDQRPSELYRTDGSRVSVLTGRANFALSVKDTPYFVVNLDDNRAELRSVDSDMSEALPGRVSGVYSRPNARYFLVGYDSLDQPGEIRWTDSGRQAPLLGPGDRVIPSPDAAHYLVMHVSSAYLYRLDTGENVIPTINEVASACFSAEGRYFAVISGGEAETEPLRIYRTDNGALIGSLRERPTQIAFSPNGSFALVNFAEDRSALWRIDTGRMITLSHAVALYGERLDPSLPLGFVTWDESQATGVFFSQAAEYTVVVYQNGESELWRVRDNPRLISRLGLGLKGCRFDVRNGRLVVWYSDGRAYLLDLPWLSAMAGGLAEHSPQELVRVACEGPLSPGRFDTKQVVAHLGGRSPAACQMQ